MAARWQMGERDYMIGNHPLFEVVKCAYRLFERPVLLSSIVRLIAYFWLWGKRTTRKINHNVVTYKQAEQMQRLRLLFRKK